LELRSERGSELVLELGSELGSERGSELVLELGTVLESETQSERGSVPESDSR
jgi:hypothetical protein